MPFHSESFVWNYFSKNGIGKAICKECGKILAMSDSSTTGLSRHLTKIHGIQRPHQPPKPDEGPPPKRFVQTSIKEIFKKDDSLEEILARLAALDGFSIHAITNSSFIRSALKDRGFSLPKNPTKVKELIALYYDKVVSNLKVNISQIKCRGGKFCIILDEYTSKQNRRYLNIQLCHLKFNLNLGMSRIIGSLPAEKLREMVKKKLQEFDVDEEHDVVASVTDGAAVMRKFGGHSPFLLQLCHAHGIHLAVGDVLYRKKVAKDLSDEESDDEEIEVSNDEEMETDAEGFSIQNEDELILKHDIGKLIAKLRKIIKLFKRSPVKNTILQKYIKEDFGKELSLYLDCKTRWNSLAKMIERYLQVSKPLSKALIDLQYPNPLSSEEIEVLQKMSEALKPIQLASDKLCSRDATLLTAEGIFSFLFKQLEKNQNQFSKDLLSALKFRIEERSNHDVISLLKYLNDSRYLSDNPCDSFPLREKLILESKTLLRRLFHESEMSVQMESTNEESTSESSESLKDALNKAIFDAESEQKQNKDDDFMSLENEFKVFESTGQRSKRLDLLYEALKTIKPTSCESERAFSMVNLFLSDNRSRLSDKTINILSVLKSHFQKC